MNNAEYEYDGFIDPTTREALLFDSISQKLMAGDEYFQIENGVIDFYNRLKFENTPQSLGFDPVISAIQVSQAPELRDAHDRAFRDSEDTGGNIYGDFENLPKITQSGHYRRMEILATLDLGDIENKIAVDFGTGPWGYASIFPRLRAAQRCIGFDVSKIALLSARKATPHEVDKKTIYATADGDFIPLVDDSVDIFFGGEVIEHVRNPFLFLQEIARVCNDSAIVILTTPNRDALHWKIFRQQYCVGPEHIALMNYEGFQKTLGYFCKAIKVFGYETSLSRLMDNEPIDIDTLAKIQARAESYPELSTGMISISKIDKGLYIKNRRELTLKECLWNSTSIAYKPQEGRPLTLFGDIEGLLMTNGMEAHIPVTGRDISLLFWGHDWSGIVEIRCGNVEISTDLYSEGGGFIRVDIDNKDLAKEVVLNHTGRKSSISHADQVIFYKFIEYTHEITVSSVSPSCVMKPATENTIGGFIDKVNVLQSESHSKEACVLHDNLHADAFFIKHQKLTAIVCCPNCHGALNYPCADFISGVPISGKAVCQQCGEVGCVSNIKFLFNPESLPIISGNGKEHTGALSVKPLTLCPHLFTPRELWNLESQQTWSAQEKAKFSLQCNSLAIALIFLKHPWSGIARVLLDGKEIRTLDLFEEKGSMHMWYPVYLGSGSHLIEVEVTGRKHPLSNDAQIFLLGAETLELTSPHEPRIIYNSRNDGNPYPKRFDDLIASLPDNGLILDCGSGDRSHPDPGVINFEYSRFRSPDVFGDGHKLPFQDNSFNLILSQAVIEHLFDPFTAVSEIFRVLKPGGTVYAESAFMQPLHAVPYHFFNTTAWGLERLFKDFQILEINHEGQLAQTLTWFYSLTSLRDKGLGDKVDRLLCITKELDTHVTNEELKNFSSYVTLLAKKPEVE